MRILYHHRTLGDGAEGIHVAEMVRAFRGLGHDVRVLSLIGEATNVRTTKQQRWSAVRRTLPGVAYEIAEMGCAPGRRAGRPRRVLMLTPRPR